MRYRDLRDWLAGGLLLTKFSGTPFFPGPDIAPDTADRYVMLTREGGPGEDVEGLLDGVGYQVMAVGHQRDYDDAEELALLLDQMVRSGGYTRTLSTGLRLINAQRTGSPPSPLEQDEADRFRFTCSYIFTIPTE